MYYLEDSLSKDQIFDTFPNVYALVQKLVVTKVGVTGNTLHSCS